MGIFRAIGIAHRTTWRRPHFYVLVVGAWQLAVILVAIPVIRLLYQLVLLQTGLGSIAYDRITHVLRNPFADVTLLVIAIVAVIATLAELVTLFVLASHHQDGDETSLRLVLRQVWGTIKKLAHPQGLLMIIYLILLLPLGQLGLTSILTKKVVVPPFISEELSKSPSMNLIYSAVLLLIGYLNLRLILTLPLLGTTSARVWEAFVTSWRLTRWRALRILGLLVVVTIPAGVASALLGAAAMAPTIATDRLAPATSPWLAAAGLSVWQIGTFVIAALLTIMIVQSLTAMMRDWLRRLGEDHRRVPTVISYSESSQVTASRQKGLWGLAAGVLILAFTATVVLNHQTMVKLINSDETEVLAHRGFIQGGVENTLPALQAAAKAGADRVEFDVMETKDGKFVVMHDTNLRRLAGRNLNVKDLTQEELTKTTVRAGGMEAKIPTLEEWIRLSIHLNLPQLLEIKLHGGETPDLVPRLLAVLDRAGVTEHYTYHTLSREVVEELKRLRPQLVVGFIVPINFGGVPEVNADFLVIEQQSYSSRFVRQAWADGYDVIVWTVDDEQQMRNYMDAAVDGIITDRPDIGTAARADIAEDKGLSGRLSDAISRSASI
ncbi:MAG TPA: glycerophosphodiester phosphodiesterase [Propionibacteriaceae bacterium]|nr:glycerophosphodiester phosphodiesterase [Propionibacteriaceae bacterium]